MADFLLIMIDDARQWFIESWFTPSSLNHGSFPVHWNMVHQPHRTKDFYMRMISTFRTNDFKHEFPTTTTRWAHARLWLCATLYMAIHHAPPAPKNQHHTAQITHSHCPASSMILGRQKKKLGSHFTSDFPIVERVRQHNGREKSRWKIYYKIHVLHVLTIPIENLASCKRLGY